MSSRVTIKENILRELSKDDWNPRVVTGMARQAYAAKVVVTKHKDIRDMIYLSARICDTTPESVISDSTLRVDYSARAFIYKYLKDENKMTYKSIGKLFNRSHASVYHNIKVLNNNIELYPEFHNDYFIKFRKNLKGWELRTA